MPLDAKPPWPELEGLTLIKPVHVVALPVQANVPRLETGGPAIVGDVAIVASSQFGFAAVDWRRGVLVWTKPAGLHVAPPVELGGAAVLIGECISPPRVPADHTLLACLRVVTPSGTDQAYIAIHGAATALEPFATAKGAQHVYVVDDHTLRWVRDDQAVVIDLNRGVAKPTADVLPPPLIVRVKQQQWSIVATDEGHIVATGAKGTKSWHTDHAYTQLLGLAYTAEGAPLVRVMNAGSFAGDPELRMIDIDATGSMSAQVALPIPGTAVTSWSLSSIGDVAATVRLDTSLTRELIAGFAANAFLVWVYPLPEVVRTDPVGVAMAPSTPELPGGVVVFHDGDTMTILPELSAPPTAPGAARAPSQNPTP